MRARSKMDTANVRKVLLRRRMRCAGGPQRVLGGKENADRRKKVGEAYLPGFMVEDEDFIPSSSISPTNQR